VEYSFFLKGTFTDDFNLLVFPFDLLALKIKVFSTKPSNLIKFHEDKFDKSKIVLRSDAISKNNSYSFYGPITLTSEASTSQEGTSFSLHHTIIYCKRKNGYFIWNLFIPTLALSVLSIAAFTIPPSKVNDRFGVSLTMTLVQVGYKFFLAQNLPALPHNTHADWFSIFSFYFLMVVTMQHAVVSIICNEYDEGPLFTNDYCSADRSSMLIIYGIYGAVMCWMLMLMYLYSSRNAMFMNKHIIGWEDMERRGLHYKQQVYFDNMVPQASWRKRRMFPGLKCPQTT